MSKEAILKRDLSQVTTIVYEGGGIAGLGEAGAWNAVSAELELQGVRPTTFGGTSAGAILAMLCAIGYSARQLREVMESTPWAKFMPNKWGYLRDLWRALTTGSYSSLDYAETWLREQVVRAGLNADVTFGDLYRQRGVYLKVLATDEARMVPVLFAPETTPVVSIVRAVLASMAIPEVWPSVIIDDVPYCDGGIFSNLPLRAVAGHLDAAQVIAIAIDYTGEDVVSPYRANGWSRARRILAATRNQRVHHPSHLYPARVIIVPRPSWAKATAFNLSAKRRGVLWAAGVTAGGRWLRQLDSGVEAISAVRRAHPEAAKAMDEYAKGLKDGKP